MRGFLRGVAWLLGLSVIAAALALVGIALMRPAEPVVETAALSGPVCPPPLIAPRAPGQPVDDIEGLRPGLTLAEAEAMLSCIDPKLKTTAEPFWHTLEGATIKGRKQLVHADRSGERFSLGLTGPIGQEAVAAVWRAHSFAPDRAPLVSALEAEVKTRYGPPHSETTSPLKRSYKWAYAPNGQPIQTVSGELETDLVKRLQGLVDGGPNEETCLKAAKMSPLDKPTWNPACGVTIRVEIEARVEDATRVAHQTVVVVDQARLAAGVEVDRTPPGFAKAPPPITPP